MNLQNIPSHKEDIRHLFRATPKGNDSIICSVSNNIATVSVAKFNSLMISGAEKYIKDLSIGDKIQVLLDGKTTIGTLLSINLSDKELCNMIMQIQLPSDSHIEFECRLPVITPNYIMLSSDYSKPKLCCSKTHLIRWNPHSVFGSNYKGYTEQGIFI